MLTNYVILSSILALALADQPSIRDCELYRGKTVIRNCQKFGLRSIPYDTFDYPETHSSIKLANNPYVCDCGIAWILNEHHSKTRLVMDWHYMKCAEPKELSGKKIAQLTVNDVCKTGSAKQIPSDVFDTQEYFFQIPGEYACDCSIVWFIRRIRDKHFLRKKNIYYVGPVYCGTPEHLKDEQVNDLSEQRVCPEKEPDYCYKKPCDETTSTCENFDGSHRCVDIDECLMKTHQCRKEEECVNQVNGYKCQCKPGYVKAKNGVGCEVFIHPCDKKPSPCEKAQKCVRGEAVGSFKCKDIDECALGKHNCHKDAECINTSPGYKCRCRPGFKDYSNGRDCKDINECLGNNSCPERAKCFNTVGSYTCACNPGYREDGVSCQDINECYGLVSCSHDAECLNTIGSYRCSCNIGYHGDGNLCFDIDECSTKNFSCPRNGKCVNTAGSYRCVCKTGYSWNGEYCLDIDECASGVQTCHRNATCKNFPGSYKCLCKEGFEHFKKGRLCLKEEKQSSKSSNTVPIPIVVGAAYFVVFIVLLMVVLVRRKRRKKEDKDSSKDGDIGNDHHQADTIVFLEQQNKLQQQLFIIDNCFPDAPDGNLPQILPNPSILSQLYEEQGDYDEDEG